MTRIVVISFNDNDVTTGLQALLIKHPDSSLMIPVTDDRNFVISAVNAAKSAKAKYHLFFSDTDDFVDKLVLESEDITVCSNPIREILREITPDDVLAISWDDSVEAHMALHSVEDYGIETWDVSDGLSAIELDQETTDDLFEEMQEALSNFIEVFGAYITAGILQNLDKTLLALIMENEAHKDVDPFDKD